MIRQFGTAPIQDNPLKTNGEFGPRWRDWLNSIHSFISTHSFLNNNSHTINPDFHWARVNGGAPRTTDGEFMDNWFVKSNGSTFTITPTIYTNSYPSSQTGSKHYANINITTPTANDFEIYQSLPNYTARFQNKEISTQSLIQNNGSNRFTLRYYVGFDTNNDGTDEHFTRGKGIYVKPGINELGSLLKLPKVDDNNQNTTITLKLLATELNNPVDFNLFHVKFEDSDMPTPLFVDHTLEKLKIDNA